MAYTIEEAMAMGATLEELCKLAGVDPEEVFGKEE